MKIRPISLIAFLIIIGLVFSAGYMTGFIQGFRNAFWFDSPGQGVVLVNDLRQLRRGDIKQAIESKELYLDKQIFLHGEYLEKGSPTMIQWYFNYFAEPRWKTAGKDHRTFMHIVAKYRNEYPIHLSTPEFTKDADESFKKDIEKAVEKEIESIKKTLTQYGWQETP
jgi:hypothetical protein